MQPTEWRYKLTTYAGINFLVFCANGIETIFFSEDEARVCLKTPEDSREHDLISYYFDPIPNHVLAEGIDWMVEHGYW